jgi:GH24 family phage-related lysozyme (muramidase)
MAVYDIEGEQFEIPDEVTGAQLDGVLMAIIQDKKAQTMETGKGKNATFVDDFFEHLGKWEGTEHHKDPGGIKTGPYGVVNTLGLNQEQDEDYDTFAKRVASRYEEVLNEQLPNVDYMPHGVKMAAMSMMWNSGKLFPAQKKALESGNHKAFSYNLLDVVTQSKGPNIPKDERWVLPGLVKRRAAEYNMVAKETGSEPIVSYEVEQLKNNDVMITYRTESGMRVLGGRIKESEAKGKKLVIKGSKSGKV